MADTTTIQITTAQKAELDSLKHNSGESYKSVLQRIIDEHESSTESLDESDVQAIVNREIEQLKREMR